MAKTYEYENGQATINGVDFDIYAHGYENPATWGHVAQLYVNGCDCGQYKIVYYNRTWERWQYQSVVAGLLRQYQNGIIADIENGLRKENGGRLKRGDKDKAQQIAKNEKRYTAAEKLRCIINGDTLYCLADLSKQND